MLRGQVQHIWEYRSVPEADQKQTDTCGRRRQGEKQEHQSTCGHALPCFHQLGRCEPGGQNTGQKSSGSHAGVIKRDDQRRRISG